MAEIKPDPDLYDEEELEMLESFERGEWYPVPDGETESKRHQKLFRSARASGDYGPVDHDVEYPWSRRNHPKKPAHLAGDGDSGDNPPARETS